MQASSKNKFIVSVILAVLLNLLLLLSVFFVRGAIKSKKNSVLTVKEQIVLYERRIEHVKNLEETLERTERDRLKIEPLFVGESTVVNFIEDLETLGEEAGVKLQIKGVRFAESVNQKPIFTLQAVGSFRDIYHFFVLLENMPYVVAFNRAGLEKFGDLGTWSSLLELKLLSFKNE